MTDYQREKEIWAYSTDTT